MLNQLYAPETLLRYNRSGLIEQEHSGFIVLVNNLSTEKAIGDTMGYSFFQRSCAKPLQASLLVDFDLINEYKLTDSEIAVCCASHVGTTLHKQQVENILHKIGLTKANLLCPPSKALTTSEPQEFGVLENNCSGKHAMMLAVCVKNGFPIENYTEPSHPVQKLILEKITQLCSLEAPPTATKDGCGVPIYATTLDKLAQGYLQLFLDKKYNLIKNAILKNPIIIGGEGRIDSEIIRASKSSVLIAKVGAGGLIVVINLQTQQSLVVKIQDCDMKARSITTIEALNQLKWLSDEEINFAPLKNLYNTDIKILNGTTIGKIEPCFKLG